MNHTMENAPRDRRIMIFVPRVPVMAHKRAMNEPLYQGWHTARWEDDAGQWIIGGILYFDEAFHVDADVPTHWREVPEDPS